MTDLLETLLAAPGLYVGTGQDLSNPEDARPVWNARFLVTPLPGRAAVSIDYEAYATDHGRFHAEHTVIGRGPTGLVLVCAHVHGDTVFVLHEDGPGRFVDRDGTSRFPVEHVIETPEPGHLVHHWRYGPPGGEIGDRDRADLRRID